MLLEIKNNWLKLFWLIPIILALSGVFGFVIMGIMYSESK